VDLRLDELARELNVSPRELDQINRELGDYYGAGWEVAQAVTAPVVVPGRWLWSQITAGKSLPGVEVKGGFTGRRKDKLGRERCYQDGKLVPCPKTKMPQVEPAPTAANAPQSPPRFVLEALKDITEYSRLNRGYGDQDVVNDLNETLAGSGYQIVKGSSGWTLGREEGAGKEKPESTASGRRGPRESALGGDSAPGEFTVGDDVETNYGIGKIARVDLPPDDEEDGVPVYKVAFPDGSRKEIYGDELQRPGEGDGGSPYTAPHNPQQAAEALRSSPVVSATDVKGDHRNKVQLLELADGSRAIYKPAEGEKSLRFGVPDGKAYVREDASWRTARLLGFTDLVPVTAVREVNGEVGSVQEYVEGAQDADQARLNKDKYGPPEVAARAAAFDYLTCQADRHSGNWLTRGGRPVLIDNGTSFPVKYVDEDDFGDMEFWRYAVLKELTVPELKGSWSELERELGESGLEPEAITLTKQRFEALAAHAGKTFRGLPGLLRGKESLLSLVTGY
jgi:hypothetical protein